MEISNTDKKYRSTATAVYSCQYHIIFATKFRRGVLTESIIKRLKSIIFENQKKFGYRVIEMEVMPDHVHLLLDVDPHVGIYKTTSRIKGISSHILREEFPELKSRLPSLWTRNKFISTVGSVSLEVVKKYIENQKNV